MFTCSSKAVQLCAILLTVTLLTIILLIVFLFIIILPNAEAPLYTNTLFSLAGKTFLNVS
jgi:hypothetical protein